MEGSRGPEGSDVKVMAWNPVRTGLCDPQRQVSRNTGLVVIVPSFRKREALLPRNRESVLSAGD